MAKKSDVRKAEAEAAKATAEAASRQAEAEAAKVKAQADAEMARTAADREKQKAVDDAAAKRAKGKEDTSTLRAVGQAGALAGGYAYGTHKANKVDQRFQATMEARNKELKKLGNAVARSPKGANTASAATAADKLKLTGGKGPRVAGAAAALLVESAAARFIVSPRLEDAPEAQAIVDSAGTAGMVASLAMLGQHASNKSTPQRVPDAVATANIEAARNGTTPFKAGEAPQIAAPKPGSKAALVAEAKAKGIDTRGMNKAQITQALSPKTQLASLKPRALPKAGVAAMVVAPIVAASQAANAAGSDPKATKADVVKSTAVAAGGATAMAGATVATMKVIEKAAPVLGQAVAKAAPVVAGGMSAKATYDEAREAGDSKLLAGLKAAGAAVVDTATVGMGMLALRSGENTRAQLREMVAERDAKTGEQPKNGYDPMKDIGKVAQTSTPRGRDAGSAVQQQPSDGKVKEYDRYDPRAGRKVHVGGYERAVK